MLLLNDEITLQDVRDFLAMPVVQREALIEANEYIEAPAAVEA